MGSHVRGWLHLVQSGQKELTKGARVSFISLALSCCLWPANSPRPRTTPRQSTPKRPKRPASRRTRKRRSVSALRWMTSSISFPCRRSKARVRPFLFIYLFITSNDATLRSLKFLAAPGVMMSHRWGFLSEFLALGSPKVGHNTQQILRILYSLHPPLQEGILPEPQPPHGNRMTTGVLTAQVRKMVSPLRVARAVDCKNFVDTRIGGWILRPANNRADPFTYDALRQQYLDIFDNAGDAQEPKSVFSRDLSLLLPLAEKILGTYLTHDNAQLSRCEWVTDRDRC